MPGVNFLIPLYAMLNLFRKFELKSASRERVKRCNRRLVQYSPSIPIKFRTFTPYNGFCPEYIPHEIL